MICKILKSAFVKPTAILMATATLLMSFTFPGNEGKTIVKIKAGTPIALELTDNISSSTAHEGQVVNFKVKTDVKQDGKVVIAAGATAMGQVVSSRSKSLMGIAGELEIVVKQVTAVDGSVVNVSSSSMTAEGNTRMAGAIVLTVFCLFGFLIHGKDVTIAAGTPISATVSSTTEIEL